MFIIDYYEFGGFLVLKRIDLEKELKDLGATFEEGRKHKKVRLNGKQTTIPRHKEIDEIMVKVIKKQLDVL